MSVTGSRDSSVGIATSYGLDGRGSIPGTGKRFFSMPPFQTCFGVQPAFSPIGTWGGVFPGGKAAEA
jgi:hypothetical protein